MYEKEYETLVLAVFDHKKNNNELQQELVSPTAGNLKSEAAKVCARRFDPKDEIVLGSFFDAEPGKDGHYRAIQHCDYQVFRPLSDFLNHRERTTTFKNIQLLAWLIDFKPRPFNANLQTDDILRLHPEALMHTATVVPKDPPAPIKEPETKEETPPIRKGKTISVTAQFKQKLREIFSRRLTWMLGAATLFLIGMIWMMNDKGECMYWRDDHYVASPCGVPKADTPLVALDRTRLQGFRRVKHLDTLTRYSVGRLWWTRVGNQIEIYSAGGKHPVYPDKTLKKVTDYVVNVCHNRGSSE